MIPIKERLESDVLIVGGGIAGLMAAIAAADKGASVILLDKANAQRGGSHGQRSFSLLYPGEARHHRCGV